MAHKNRALLANWNRLPFLERKKWEAVRFIAGGPAFVHYCENGEMGQALGSRQTEGIEHLAL